MKRNLQYDLLRFVAMLFVLGIHIEILTRTFGQEKLLYDFISKLVISLTMCCNYLFFMLSGRFILNKRFENNNDYFKFYYNRLATLFVPLLVISIFALFITRGFNISYLWKFFPLFLSNNIVSAYWFAYQTIALMVIVPFMAKCIQQMSLNDKKLLIGLGFFFEIVLFISERITSKSFFNIANFPLLGWSFYMLLGNIAEEILSNKQKKFFIIAMPACIVIKALLQSFVDPTYAYAKLDSPFMLIETLGFYFLFLEVIIIKSERIKSFVSFTAKHSYSFYLIHPLIIILVSQLFNFEINYKLSIAFAIICFIIVFILTLILAYLFDNFIFEKLKKLIIGWSKQKFSD